MPCAHCKEDAEAEVAKRREEERRRAEAARRRAQDEAFARILEEDRRRAQEAHRRAMEQQEEMESRERERRERERERHERETSSAAASAPPSLAQRILVYEAKWDELRNNRVAVGQLRFCDVPWPVFGDVRWVDDVTRERVLAFVLYERKKGEGQAKTVRSEILRWHPDKFNGRILDKVIEGDREAVRDTAGHVARILTNI